MSNYYATGINQSDVRDEHLMHLSCVDCEVGGDRVKVLSKQRGRCCFYVYIKQNSTPLLLSVVGEYKITTTLNKTFRVFVPVLFSILAFGASVPVAFAADTGFKNPTVAESVGSGTGWSGLSSSTINNAMVVDGTAVDLTSSLATTTTSKYLKLTNFHFAIPPDATIVGIGASVTRRGTSNSADLIKDGSIIL